MEAVELHAWLVVMSSFLPPLVLWGQKALRYGESRCLLILSQALWCPGWEPQCLALHWEGRSGSGMFECDSFLCPMRLFLFQAYFWMIWASFEAPVAAFLNSKHFCVSELLGHPWQPKNKKPSLEPFVIMKFKVCLDLCAKVKIMANIFIRFMSEATFSEVKDSECHQWNQYFLPWNDPGVIGS